MLEVVLLQLLESNADYLDKPVGACNEPVFLPSRSENLRCTRASGPKYIGHWNVVEDCPHQSSMQVFGLTRWRS